jgi:hypothetical protein
MGKKSISGSGMNILDHILRAEKKIFVFKYKNSLMRMRFQYPGIYFDHGSGIQDGKIRIREKHFGSATPQYLW